MTAPRVGFASLLLLALLVEGCLVRTGVVPPDDPAKTRLLTSVRIAFLPPAPSREAVP